jgi:tRNA(Arg) A34 adenosine deaminase TadA
MDEEGSTVFKRNEKFLDILTKAAVDIPDPVRNYRLTSAIVYKNSIISFGANSYKTDPFQARWSKNDHAIHLHAEVNAIKNAIKRGGVDILKKSTLYIARVRSINGTGYERAMAKPCIGCRRCIAEFGIKNVVYTTNEGHRYL